MKQTLTLAALLVLLSTAAIAQQPAGKPAADADQLAAVLPECGVPSTITELPIETKLPSGLQGRIINVESESPYCQGRYFFLKKATRSYLGIPWIIEGYQGTIEQKMKAFAWERLQDSVGVELGTERSAEGLRKVRVIQKTTYGPLPIDGLVDDDGKVFLTGAFFTDLPTLTSEREKSVAPLLVTAPTKGDPNAKITVVEFSDFQCPSCKFGAEYMKPILEKYGSAIRYHRVDMPLMTAHPWAFPAALFGRAIWKQKPEAFWAYKDAVYASQGELNTFVIEDFARNFASDQGLDMKKYQADVESEALRDEILKGTGTAFTLGVGGTPTYMVNGRFVVGGKDGKVLDEYLAKLVAKQ